MSVCRKISLIVIGISLIVISIIFASLIGVANTDLDDSSYEFIQLLGKNWSNGPITDVANFCSIADYFLADSWPGTTPGCNCFGSISRGYCNRSKNSFERYCADVAGISPVQYVTLEGNNLCVVRQQISYLDLNVSPETCLSTEKSCGVVDSLNNILCIPSTSACPINSVSLQDKSIAVPSGYSVKSLNTNNLVFSNKNTSGNIVITTKVSDFQPCADPAEVNSQSYTYKLDKYFGNSQCVTNVQGSTFDSRYKVFGNTNFYNLLNDNGVIPKVATLPMYSVTSYYHNVNLYYTSYFGLRVSCKDKFKSSINVDTRQFINDLQEVGQQVQQASSNSLIAEIMAIFAVIFCTICGITLFTFKCSGNRMTCCIFYIIFLIFSTIFLILALVFAAITSSGLNNLGNAHLQLNGCLDGISQFHIENFSKKVSNAKTNSTVGVIFVAICMIILIIELVVNNCSDDSDSEVEDSDPNVLEQNNDEYASQYGVGVDQINIQSNVNVELEKYQNDYKDNYLAIQEQKSEQINNNEENGEKLNINLNVNVSNNNAIPPPVEPENVEYNFGGGNVN